MNTGSNAWRLSQHPCEIVMDGTPGIVIRATERVQHRNGGRKPKESLARSGTPLAMGKRRAFATWSRTSSTVHQRALRLRQQRWASRQARVTGRCACLSAKVRAQAGGATASQHNAGHYASRICPRFALSATHNGALCLAPGPASATLAARAAWRGSRVVQRGGYRPPLRSTSALAVLAQSPCPAHPPLKSAWPHAARAALG